MKSAFSKLEKDIQEKNEFHKKGLERIKLYYSLPENERKAKTGLKEPPHEILLKRAGNLIVLGLGILEKRVIEEEALDDILIGVGTEILLKSIILKEDPKFFIENIDMQAERTLSFQKCKKTLIDLLAENLTEKQVRRIREVLELIQIRRNNSVHLGFHLFRIYREDYQIAHVLEFLFSYFFEDKAKDVIKRLREFKEKTKVASGMDYEPVDFPIGETRS